MRLKKHKSFYTIKNAAMILDASVKVKGVIYCLIAVDPRVIDHKSKTSGIPNYFAFNGKEIIFYPAPDKAYEASVTYTEYKVK